MARFGVAAWIEVGKLGEPVDARDAVPRAVAPVGLLEVIGERARVGLRGSRGRGAGRRRSGRDERRGLTIPYALLALGGHDRLGERHDGLRDLGIGIRSTIASPSSERAPSRGSNGILPRSGASTSRDRASPRPSRRALPRAGEIRHVLDHAEQAHAVFRAICAARTATCCAARCGL